MNHLLKYTLASLFVFGCENTVNSVQNGTLATKFILKNSQGNEATQFQFGEDITFHYSIENKSRHSYLYTNQHSGPFVIFEVYQGDSLIGSSLDGLAFLPVIIADSIEAGETLIAEYNWVSAPSHSPLSVAEYTAKANPILEFNDAASLENEEIEFQITPRASDLVKISDLPPDSIQLDPFDLNSIVIANNEIILNLSYSGGCTGHDFELFMSPAAFMESNPVQANLFLRHNGHDDACDAYITTEVSFNLQPVAELYQQFYGRKDEIILNVFEYFTTDPKEHLSGSYFPK